MIEDFKRDTSSNTAYHYISYIICSCFDSGL